MGAGAPPHLRGGRFPAQRLTAGFAPAALARNRLAAWPSPRGERFAARPASPRIKPGRFQAAAALRWPKTSTMATARAYWPGISETEKGAGSLFRPMRSEKTPERFFALLPPANYLMEKTTAHESPPAVRITVSGRLQAGTGRRECACGSGRGLLPGDARPAQVRGCDRLYDSLVCRKAVPTAV